MAEKGWIARVAAAAGAAAGIGAAQLGLGYGLGVVVWPPPGTPDDSVWLGSLGWATWIAASATVFGAVLASRLGGDSAARLRGPWRFALAVSAAVGALVAVALIALPARASVRVDTFSPEVIAGGYAVIGLLFGLVVAYWAVVSRPVAANLIATAAWLWALAVAAVVVELTLHRTSATYLTSWQFAESGGDHRYGAIYWPSAVLTLGAALLIGIVAAAPAVRRGHFGAGAAASGAVGPLLVAAAFFVLAPQLTGALGPLESAYLIAPYAVLSGLAGSAMTVALGQAAANRRARPTAAGDAEVGFGSDAGPAPADEVGAAPAALPAQRRRARFLAKFKSGREPEAAATEESTGLTAAGRAELQPRATATARPAAALPSASTRPSPATQPAIAQPAIAQSAIARPAIAQPATSARSSATGKAASASASSATKFDEAGKRAPIRTVPAARPGAAVQPSGPRRATPSVAMPPRAAPSPAMPPPAAPSPAMPPPAAPSPENRRPVTPRPSGSVGADGSIDEVPDAELAAAARRGRGRGKKASSAEPEPPRAPSSSVTPPPTSPTIAQINPRPPTAR